MKNGDKKWIQVVIRDPEGLPGMHLVDILKCISEIITINYIYVSDVDGVNIPFEVITGNKSFNFKSILKKISNVTQFDWGDFFLFAQRPGEISAKEHYPSIIARTETTVRAVDDTYFYVYTPCEKLVKALSEHFEIDSVIRGNLSSLEYPF